MYVVSNTKGYSITTGYTYTRSGSNATVTWRDFSGAVYQLHSGSPLSTLSVGFGMTLLNPFGFANEVTQDARYTGTWTIAENFHGGVTGETGKFDLRRIGVANLTIDPRDFNPLETENVQITADIVALPVTTELTPDGWAPSGTVNWLIDIDEPMSPGTPVISLSGSLSPGSPDASGKVGSITTSWNGAGNDGEPLMNASYPLRAQALAGVGFGNVLSKEKLELINVGALGVIISDLDATPEDFDPQNGEMQTITFGLEAVGFENPNLSWHIDIYQDDELVRALPEGEALSTSQTDVSTEWDGFLDSGEAIAGEYEIRVMGVACEGETLARNSSPTRQRVLFQVGGVCSFDNDMIARGTPDPTIGRSIESQSVV